jgi:hypothetical protein
LGSARADHPREVPSAIGFDTVTDGTLTAAFDPDRVPGNLCADVNIGPMGLKTNDGWTESSKLIVG